MILGDPGWLRPVLAFVLAVFGVLLRFVLPSRLGAFGLKRFRTRPDEDLFLRIRGSLGAMLLIWSGWLLFQILIGMPESWVTAVWAPLTLVVVLVPALFSRLYVSRHLPEETGMTPAPDLKSWLWIFLREAVPLGAILVPILVIRKAAPDLPPEIPTGWDFGRGDFVWTDREIGTTILRHRTMAVYGVLLGMEAVYLIVRWGLGKGADVAGLMLSRPLWLFYLFKTGWVLLFAGFNLALIDRARGEGPGMIAVLPGLFVFGVLGILIAIGLRGPRGAGSG